MTSEGHPTFAQNAKGSGARRDAVEAPRADADRLAVIMSSYYLYCDAGGGKDHGFIVVAGYLSTFDRWNAFTAEWNELLARFEIPYFHRENVLGFCLMLQASSSIMLKRVLPAMSSLRFSTGSTQFTVLMMLWVFHILWLAGPVLPKRRCIEVLPKTQLTFSMMATRVEEN